MPQTMTSFLGIPVTGDIVKAERRVAQRPIDDFRPLILAVLDIKEITGFGWKQYTPYFNDGDPCVFSAYGAWFSTEEDKDRDPDDDELTIDYHPVLGPKRWDSQLGTHVQVKQLPEITAIYETCKALSDAIEGGEFDDVLLEAFGDHAEVTVSSAGITVEFYQHD